MQRLEVSGAVRPLYWSLGVKRVNDLLTSMKYLLSALGEVLQSAARSVLNFSLQQIITL